MCTKEALLGSIDMLRDIAWHNAIKYRYDPVLGRAHDEYLQNLNAILDHAKTNQQQDKKNESTYN